MPAFTLFHEFKKFVGDKIIDLDSDTFKAMLTNTAPSAANNTVKADITEIAAGNGYTAGGITLTSLSYAETGAGTGIWRWSAANLTWTASGGAIAAHRYLVIYDDTPTSPLDPLVGFLDRGSSDVISDGNQRMWPLSGGMFEMN